MKVALVHDWLVTVRGGEKVLEALLELFPEAPVFTLFYEKSQMPDSISTRNVIFPRWLHPLRRFRKLLLPILPAIMENFDFEDYDLVISSSSCVAKGIVTGPRTLHVSYVHSPMRYIWDQRLHYTSSLPAIPGLRALIAAISTRLRIWDVTSSQRVDLLLSNSAFVAKRMSKFYGRSSVVVPPPVQRLAEPTNIEQGNDQTPYFLVAGAWVPYKRIDLSISAVKALGGRLVIAGAGPEESRLRRLAASANVEFCPSPSNSELAELLRGTRALLFPGIEDFGMLPIEAMMEGTPVIAYQAGGALDYIEHGKTGLYFNQPHEASLIAAIKELDLHSFDRSYIKSFAQRFSKANFQNRIKSEVAKLLVSHNRDIPESLK